MSADFSANMDILLAVCVTYSYLHPLDMHWLRDG
jgi:hypothetical protein